MILLRGVQKRHRRGFVAGAARAHQRVGGHLRAPTLHQVPRRAKRALGVAQRRHGGVVAAARPVVVRVRVRVRRATLSRRAVVPAARRALWLRAQSAAVPAERGRTARRRTEPAAPARAARPRSERVTGFVVVPAFVVVVVLAAGELVQRAVVERVVVGIVAVGVVVVVRVEHVQRGGARGVVAAATRVVDVPGDAPAVRARFALVSPVEDDIRGVARRSLQRRGVPVGRARVGVSASLHQRVHDIRRAAKRRHVQRRRVHDERAVVGAARQKRLHHFERRALTLSGDAAGDAAARDVRVFSLFRRAILVRQASVRRLVVSRLPGDVRRLDCDSRLVLGDASLGRLVYVRRDSQVQRRVVQSLGGALGAPERARGGGAPGPHVLDVRVPRAPVRVRTLGDQRANQVAVHARGGGVHGAVA
mmetsp:Transcript_584/g.2391  ORF Transcript_584/g.2391 Transcript_584/m.2391 type:complete len:420 (-) Transcript_584:754-2013(-)